MGLVPALPERCPLSGPATMQPAGASDPDSRKPGFLHT